MTQEQKLDLCKEIDAGIQTVPENSVVRHFLISFTNWHEFQRFASHAMPEVGNMTGKQIIKHLLQQCNPRVQQIIFCKYEMVK